MTEIQQTILRVLAFYDVFEFPLTAEEIVVESRKLKAKSDIQGALRPQVVETYVSLRGRQAQSDIVNLKNVMYELENMVTEGMLEKEEVFYCLKGRRAIIKQRKMRYPESLRKILKAQKWIRLIRTLPFVRNVYAAGSVAMGNARRESDVDLVIVAKKGRVWSSRFFVNTVLAILSMRVHGRHWVGKNMFAYVLRMFGLEHRTITIDPTRGTNTLCTAFFIDESVDPKTVLPDDRQFQFWVERWLSTTRYTRHITRDIFIVEMIMRLIPERLLRWGQEKVLMPKQLRERVCVQNNDVILNDVVIKLHLVDRRREYDEAYLDRLKALNV